MHHPLTYTRLRAWGRHWRLDIWWPAVVVLGAVVLRECEARPQPGPAPVRVAAHFPAP